MTTPEYLRALNDIVTPTPQSFLKAWEAASIVPTEGSVTSEQIEWMIEFMKQHPEIKSVLEIGTNAGISSGIFLSARPDITLVSVDIGTHPYVLEAQKLLQKLFPRQYIQIIGDSTVVLPNIKSLIKPDLIFIDGGHTAPIPSIDIKNALALCKPSTWIIIDDCWPEGKQEKDVFDAVQKSVRSFEMVCKDVMTSKTRSWTLCKKIF
jgi:predicted O-methyltransferase YrrM